MDIIVYRVHGGLVGIGKSQRKKCQKRSAKGNILFPPIEVAIDIDVYLNGIAFLLLKSAHKAP